MKIKGVGPYNRPCTRYGGNSGTLALLFELDDCPPCYRGKRLRADAIKWSGSIAWRICGRRHPDNLTECAKAAPFRSRFSWFEARNRHHKMLCHRAAFHRQTAAIRCGKRAGIGWIFDGKKVDLSGLLMYTGFRNVLMDTAVFWGHESVLPTPLPGTLNPDQAQRHWAWG